MDGFPPPACWRGNMPKHRRTLPLVQGNSHHRAGVPTGTANEPLITPGDRVRNASGSCSHTGLGSRGRPGWIPGPVIRRPPLSPGAMRRRGRGFLGAAPGGQQRAKALRASRQQTREGVCRSALHSAASVIHWGNKQVVPSGSRTPTLRLSPCPWRFTTGRVSPNSGCQG